MNDTMRTIDKIFQAIQAASDELAAHILAEATRKAQAYARDAVLTPPSKAPPSPRKSGVKARMEAHAKAEASTKPLLFALPSEPVQAEKKEPKPLTGKRISDCAKAQELFRAGKTPLEVVGEMKIPKASVYVYHSLWRRGRTR